MYRESALDETRLELGVPYLRCVDVDDIINVLYDFDHHFCISEEINLRSPPLTSSSILTKGEEIHDGLTPSSRMDDVYHHDGVLYVAPTIVLRFLELSDKDRGVFEEHVPSEAFMKGQTGPSGEITTSCDDYVNVINRRARACSIIEDGESWTYELEMDVPDSASVVIGVATIPRYRKQLHCLVKLCSNANTLYRNKHRSDGTFEVCSRIADSRVLCYRTHFSGRPLTVLNDAWVGPVRLHAYVCVSDIMRFVIPDEHFEALFCNTQWRDWIHHEPSSKHLFVPDCSYDASDVSTGKVDKKANCMLKKSMYAAVQDTKTRTGLSVTSLLRYIYIREDGREVPEQREPCMKLMMHPRAAMDLVNKLTVTEGFERMLCEELTKILARSV
ncbi:hypothetical protein CYMTET_47307 [Cymbomonas tetramitiformis]|uniref:Uncharacterized protein n=1 Tax=Cymbomonas tetramitiformis TaxID=36881 RepID=A0AAE0EW49_9CHLO|nr:hypothetical protein CYMTET_47307 [Cymbomonas tetramitiformis]